MGEYTHLSEPYVHGGVSSLVNLVYIQPMTEVTA